MRGRALRQASTGQSQPDFGLYLSAKEPGARPWPSRWVVWRDFRAPEDYEQACQALLEAWRRSATERVEVACHGGRGRTGTALACLAVIDGMPAREAVSYVRGRYHSRSIETPWQRRYVSRFVDAADAP